MRKILILAMMIIALSSCGGAKESKTNENNIQFWSFFTGGDGNYMDKIVDKFNAENTDFKVNMTVIDWNSYYTKLSTAFLSGDLPDIATSHSSLLSSIATYGETYSIDEIDSQFDWSQFPTTTAEVVLLDGKHVGVPVDTHGFVLYYNLDLVAGTSLVDENGKWLANSWPALIAGLEEVKTKYPDTQAFGLSNPDVSVMRTWYALYRQAGGVNFLNEDGTLSVDIEPATMVMKALKELFDKGYGKLTNNATSDLLQDGRIAVAFEGSWISGAVRAKQGNIRIVTMPNFFGQAGFWANNHVLFFPKTSKKASQKQINALKFAQFVIDNGNIWAGAGHIPAKTMVQQSSEYQNNPNASFQDLAVNMYPFPKNKNLNLVTDTTVLFNQLQLYLDGTISDPKAVFDNTNKEINNMKTM